MGFTDSDFDKPLIGVVNSWSEVDPGHWHLRTLAEWVKEGVREAGGTPAEFNTVAPCDGIAQGKGMHYVLPLRDVIAASVELMVGANRFDGLVMLCTCDKIVPGMLIAAARLNLPTILVTGGPMLPGEVKDWASAEAAARDLHKQGARIVVVTLGERGALVWQNERADRISAFKIKPVDATAAGDAFVLALAVAYSSGRSLAVAVREASAAGSRNYENGSPALSVRRCGIGRVS